MRVTIRSVAWVLLLAVAWAAAGPATSAAEHESKETAAVAAAEEWLALVDSGEFSESWERAAEYFRNAVPRERWEQSLTAVRSPLGKLIARKVESTRYATSLPGAPDGEYVVIQFAASFENKESAIETVTPMLEGDGGWRISGYYIK